MRTTFFSFFFLIFTSACAIGQSFVTGTVIDKGTNEPIPFAKVKVEGLSLGANTDFDGNFKIKLNAGEYVLIVSMALDGYADEKIDVSLAVNDSKHIDVSLIKKVQDIIVMNVTHQKTEKAKTVEADDARRRDEKGATEGVTDEQMKERGVTTAVEAVQMAPGLSVEDGKNVYVRGLGDRYTKTILNGMEIPGLDPDRNSVQMDIFPANVIDNITVYKTFLPNLTGDYTGGLVDISTKDFPSKKTFFIKAGLGYNTASTFNKDYLSYNGGAIDFLGFDDGTRALPVRSTDKFPHPVLGDITLEKRTKQFGKTMAAEEAKNFLNQNYAISYGNKHKFETKKKKSFTYGYNAVLNYRNSHRYYENIQYNEFRKVYNDDGSPVNELDKFRASKGTLSENNIIWSALIGQAIQIKRSKISLNLFHTQNGTSSASRLTEGNFEQNPSTLEKQNLMYSQRSISNVNLAGRHFLDTLNKWKMDWKVSPTYSSIKDPDTRSTALEVLDEPDANGNPVYAYSPAVGSQIRRTWRNLSEYNVSARMDFRYNFVQWDSLKSELSFGALNTYKSRDFDVLDYFFELEGNSTFSGDPNWYFQDENIWTPEADSGTYAYGQRELANTYQARQNVSGIYVMNQLPLTSKFEATYGVRVEKATNWYTGQNNTGTVKYLDEIVLDEWNVLPSLNTVYKFEKKTDSTNKFDKYTNLRAAYAMTVARPSFKEKSIAQLYDPLQGRTFNGNIDLLQTNIHNLDLRWEHFFGRTELVSASAFYKRFINPIELVAYNSAPNEIQPLNAGTADVYGIELEVRKAIGFNKDSQKHLSWMVGSNFTYVASRIDMREVNITTGDLTRTEKSIRIENAREGEVIGNYRSMYGQSPYIINAFTTFKNDSLGLVLNLSYNVQGKKLAVIGIGSLPDVYEQPFHSLNFKASKVLGKEERWKASLSARNILMSVRQKNYESFNAENQVYDYFNQGMTISGSVSFTLEGKKK